MERKSTEEYELSMTFFTLTDHLDAIIKLLSSRTFKEFYICSVFIFKILFTFLQIKYF